MLTAEHIQALQAKLKACYPNFYTPEGFEEILHHHSDKDPQDLDAAVFAHVDESQYFPSPSNITDQLARITEQRAADRAARVLESYKRPEAEVPQETHKVTIGELQYWPGFERKSTELLGQTFTLVRAYCLDCSDTGMARFWYNPNKPSQVWTRAQWIQLTDEQQDQVRISSCTCHCDRGLQLRPKYAGTHPVHGASRPTFNTIQRLSNKRRAAHQ
jgi:hypothetical protein